MFIRPREGRSREETSISHNFLNPNTLHFSGISYRFLNTASEEEKLSLLCTIVVLSFRVRLRHSSCVQFSSRRHLLIHYLTVMCYQASIGHHFSQANMSAKWIIGQQLYGVESVDNEQALFE